MHLLTFGHYGEIAETASGNVTADFYSTSLQQGRNAVITKDGAMSKRRGTAFVDECYVDGTANPMPFLFGYRATDAAYMLEFSGHATNRVYVRVFSETGTLVTASIDLTVMTEWKIAFAHDYQAGAPFGGGGHAQQGQCSQHQQGGQEPIQALDAAALAQ